ncbi:MAG: hypothetical protein ACJ8EL_22415 [Rhizomicrobium sp.]
MARKERTNGHCAAHKDDGDINGTIEVIATFVYASIRERVFRQRQEPQMKIWLN